MTRNPKIMELLIIIGYLLTACATSTGSTGIKATEVDNELTTAVPTPAILQPTATRVHIEHNGITLAYDPMLFGDDVIQDIPASANQGLFDQPSPAHTRIGFAPSAILADSAYPWRLTLEPNITVYNLNDFGSFATGDPYTREQVALFQELLDKRPSTITETIPVIPPVNAGQIIRAQVKWLDFGSGAGVRFLTQYDQAANPIYDGPGATYRPIGELMSGESASVFGSDVTNRWLAIECPRGIGLACWVTSDTAVNEPTAFVRSDG